MIAVLAGCLWLPVSKVDAKALKKSYTVKYLPMGAKQALPVEGYVEDADGLYIGIPRQDGLKLISDFSVSDARSGGTPVVFPE